jgi:hypothetical protein
LARIVSGPVCIVIACTFLALGAAACAAGAHPSAKTARVAATAANPFLSPISPLQAGEPTAITTATCEPVGEGYGAVRGTAVLADGRPAQNAVLYLAEFVGTDSGMPLVSLDIAKAPQAIVGSDGSYCFAKVPPGKYGLVIWEAVHSTLVADPSTGFSLEVVVSPGAIVTIPQVSVP